MAARKPFDVGAELLERFDYALRVSEYLVGVVPKATWRVEPEREKARTIAAIVVHMQGIRRTFGKMGSGREIAPRMDPARITQRQAAVGLKKSRVALMELFTGAIARGEGRIKGLPRRVIDMMTYLIQHEAHHRGQIVQRIKDRGLALPDEATTIVWGWRRLR